MMIPYEGVPPIWHPIDRFRAWRKRRIRSRVVADFSSYLMPIIKSRAPSNVLNELVNVQPMGTPCPPDRPIEEQEERLRVAQEAAAQEIAERMSDESVLKWNIIYRRNRWWNKLWRWAKGTPASEGCCT